MIRRVGGLLIAVLMLQLNVRYLAAACSTDFSHAKTAATKHAKTESHHHQATATLPQVEHSQASCEPPVRADCCQAMISCGGTVFSTRISTPVAAQREIVVIALFALQFPSSRVTAPEPPPPKA
jgi:hypothetical protein